MAGSPPPGAGSGRCRTTGQRCRRRGSARCTGPRRRGRRGRVRRRASPATEPPPPRRRTAGPGRGGPRGAARRWSLAVTRRDGHRDDAAAGDRHVAQRHGHRRRPGPATATVLTVSALSTGIEFVDDTGVSQRPPDGVLYPGGLTVGQQFVVEYAADDPTLARVAGRSAINGLIMPLAVIVVSWLVAGPALWTLNRLDRRREAGTAAPAVPIEERDPRPLIRGPVVQTRPARPRPRPAGCRDENVRSATLPTPTAAEWASRPHGLDRAARRWIRPHRTAARTSPNGGVWLPAGDLHLRQRKVLRMSQRSDAAGSGLSSTAPARRRSVPFWAQTLIGLAVGAALGAVARRSTSAGWTTPSAGSAPSSSRCCAPWWRR